MEQVKKYFLKAADFLKKSGEFLRRLLKSVDLKRIKWSEILITVIIAAMVGVIVSPALGECVANDRKIKCNSHMYTIMDKLSEHLKSEAADGEWHDMVLNGRSNEALNILVDEALRDKGIKIDSSDYYFEKRGNALYLRCGEHQELKDRKLLLEGTGEEEEKAPGTLGWNANVSRRIADVTALGGRSFIIDAGSHGRYCISAWDWADYIAGATAEDGKTYGASTVYYDGMLYYYPDGFRVRNTYANSNPFRYAVDPDNTRQAAYCIPVDTASVVSGRFSSQRHEGSLMAEEGEIYIWQTRPSKTQNKGWIKIECQNKKL